MMMRCEGCSLILSLSLYLSLKFMSDHMHAAAAAANCQYAVHEYLKAAFVPNLTSIFWL